MSTEQKTLACIVCQRGMSEVFGKLGFHYFTCPACRHFTTYPYPCDQHIKMHYTKGFQDQNYHSVLQNRDVYRSAMGRIRSLIESDLGRRGSSLSGISLLDIGCFTGDFLEHMQASGAVVYGIELQKQAVEIANRMLKGRVFQADVLKELPIPQKKFGMVTMLGIIEHVVDPASLVNRSWQLLEPGGLLVIQTPDASSLWARIMGKYWPPFTPVEHIHLFSKNGLTKILQRSGFTQLTLYRHWKVLSIRYVFEMLSMFGPELQKILAPVYRLLPDPIRGLRLPFYIGEMVVIARKPG